MPRIIDLTWDPSPSPNPGPASQTQTQNREVIVIDDEDEDVVMDAEPAGVTEKETEMVAEPEPWYETFSNAESPEAVNCPFKMVWKARVRLFVLIMRYITDKLAGAPTFFSIGALHSVCILPLGRRNHPMEWRDIL